MQSPVKTHDSCVRHRLAGVICAALALASGNAVRASDHLDTPTVIADPRADIGDLYAWSDPAGGRLNLVMTIVGHSFSDRLDYVFHIDSGRRFGRTTATVTVTCSFHDAARADCRLDDIDRAQGDPREVRGLTGTSGRLRVFAGLRDDPFFNNVRGTRAAYQLAIAALPATGADAAGCPQLDSATSAAVLDAWRHTDGGPARNFLAGWTPASLVVSVDLKNVSQGGPLLAVWGATVRDGRQIDRAARPLTGNALLATAGGAEESNRLKEAYNAATPAEGASFAPEIAKGLALYDSFDGVCGNAWLARRQGPPRERYRPLAELLADDRLWVNSAARRCTALFAVERAALTGERRLSGDCGGRAPSYDAVNTYRSLLVTGGERGIDDGLSRDERPPSDAAFPFLAAPDPEFLPS